MNMFDSLLKFQRYGPNAYSEMLMKTSLAQYIITIRITRVIIIITNSVDITLPAWCPAQKAILNKF